MRIANRLNSVSPSATLDITSKAKKMRSEGIDVVGLGAGEPDFDTPDHIKEAAIQSIKEGFTKYTPSSGIPELRNAISKKLQQDNGLNYDPSQIVVSSGAKHSLYNVFQAICNPGDEVLIPSPYWLSYPEMVRMAEAIPVFVKTKRSGSFKMTEAALLSSLSKKTKALILNSPSNPTGAVYTEKELRVIADIAVKNKILVVSDEIYEKLVYGNNKHVSIASFGKDIYDSVVTINGVSKSYSMTGWRIGYAAGPKDIMTAISNFQSHATSNPTSISQRAALAAIAGNQDCVIHMKNVYQKRRDLMVSIFKSIKGVDCFVPDGAFYLFCDISSLKIDSVTLATRLLSEAKVAVIPGQPFGEDNYIRLSFATSEQNIEKGILRIKEWVEKHG